MRRTERAGAGALRILTHAKRDTSGEGLTHGDEALPGRKIREGAAPSRLSFNAVDWKWPTIALEFPRVIGVGVNGAHHRDIVIQTCAGPPQSLVHEALEGALRLQAAGDVKGAAKCRAPRRRHIAALRSHGVVAALAARRPADRGV